MVAASVLLYFTGCCCLLVCALGIWQVIDEKRGIAKDTGGHAHAIVGALILCTISAGLFALASLAWSAA